MSALQQLLQFGASIVAGVIAYLLSARSEHALLVAVTVTAIALGLCLAYTACRAGRELRETRRALKEMLFGLEHAPPAILFCNVQGDVTYANDRFAELLGATGRQLRGVNLAAKPPAGIPSELHKEVLDTMRARKDWHGEIFFPNAAPDGKHMLTSLRPIVDNAGKALYVLVLAEEISDQNAYSQRLFMQANYDMLTGLPNRHNIVNRLEKTLAARRDADCLSLVYLNLDRFRLLNDSLGHERGDTILRRVATRLRAALPAGDLVAHLNGDSFLAVLHNVRDEEAARVVLAMKKAIAEPLHIDDQELSITASLGLSTWPEDGVSAHQLLRRAEAAMFTAKDKGGNSFYRYRHGHDNKAASRLAIETQLRYAIERGELDLHYQPVIGLRTNRLVGVEVLLRWHNDILGQLRPDEFIPIAEETGLILPIGDWVLEQACQQAMAWQRDGVEPLRMAINICARQLENGHIIGSVRRALDNSGLPPQLLDLEVTERLLIADAEHNREVLYRLKELGISLSLDDFGTGYASLSYLKYYPFDILKIDRAFLRDATAANDSRALIYAIIAMAHALGMEVIAEGVELAEQRTLLRDRACDMAQGYLFSAPMPAEHFQRWALQYQAVHTVPEG